MSGHEADEQPVLDQLIRDYLGRQTSKVDPARLMDRLHAETLTTTSDAAATTAEAAGVVHQDSHIDRPETVMRNRPRFVSWWIVTSLAVLVSFLCGRQLSDQPLNASVLLKDVQSVHEKGRDDYYLIRFDPDPRYWNPADPLTGPSLSRLWTRGDRFWADCAIGDITFKLGREATGTVWISPVPEKGIRFSNQLDQLPKTVARICQINSMSVPRLLNEVLVDFDHHSSTAVDHAGEMRTLVWARLKPGRTDAFLSHALLEIDTETNMLVRLVLWTVQAGKPHGTVTCTLLESSQIDDEQYEMSSHLTEGAVIEQQTLPSPDYRPALNERDVTR